jgi:hypothetical protein
MLPPKPSFRFFKFTDSKGRWYKINKKICSVESLKRYFEHVGIEPTALYASVAYFLNPQKVKGKFKRVTGSITDFMILGTDYLFEIDEDDISDFIKGLEVLKKTGFSNFEVCKTIRGYQCRVCDFQKYVDLNRTNKNSNYYCYIEHKMKIFTKLLKEKGLNFDYKVYDPMRVCRVRGFGLIIPLDVGEFAEGTLALVNLTEPIPPEINVPVKNDDQCQSKLVREKTCFSYGIETSLRRMDDKPHQLSHKTKFGGVTYA